MAQLKSSQYNVTRLIVLIIPIIFFLNGCAIPPPAPQLPRVTLSPLFNPKMYPRLAIFVEDNTGKFRNGGGLREVEDEFMRAAIEKGYILAARSDIESLIKELKFQKSNLTEKQAAEIGHVLNVPAVIIVSINNVSSERYQHPYREQRRSVYQVEANISARMISTELAEVMWISSYSSGYLSSERGREEETKSLAPVANVVASGLPRKF